MVSAATAICFWTALVVSQPATAAPGEVEDAVARGLAYVDGRAATWITTPFSFVHSDDKTCTLSCHTTVPYVMARADMPPSPSWRQGPTALASIRSRLADRIGRWAQIAPYYDFNKVQSRVTEAMTNAVAELLLARGGQPGPMLERALDNVFELQLEGGDFDWMDASLAPFENRRAHYWGAALLAFALGDREDSRAEKLRTYLRRQYQDQNLHARAMAVRAASAAPGILTSAQVRDFRSELFAKQRPDGSWATADLGPFSSRLQGTKAVAGDGYATGLAVLTLLESGSDADEASLARAKAWLLANQDASGAWPMKSLNQPNDPFNNLIISDAATAYAVMALHRLNVSH